MIRFVVGFLLVFGSAGGLDHATNAQLVPLLATAAVGLGLMYWGTRKTWLVKTVRKVW